MENAFKIAIKIFMILLGSMMLLGGGICVATNIMFAAPTLFQPDTYIYLTLMSISALAAWFGWVIIKFARK